MKKSVFLLISGLVWFTLSAADIVPDGDEPLSVEECYSRGRQLLMEEQYEQANEWFKKAEGLLLKEEEARSQTRESRAEKRQSDVVREVEQNIIDQAHEAFARNNYAQALEFYQYALESAVKDKDIYYNIGVICIKLKDYGRAAEAFEKVLEFDAVDTGALYNLGVIYENYLNDPRKAVAYYRKYVSNAPKSFDAEQVKSWISYLERSIE